MPQIVEPLAGSPEPSPNRIRWTRGQCHAIQAAGLLTGRYALIDGEIISRMGQRPPHAVALTLLLQFLVSWFGALHVRIQTSIDVAAADPLHNEPEPDAAVTRQPATAYADRHPGPDELELVVEISDTALRFDRTTKATLYARSGIPEYWVLDLSARALYVHRGPSESGYTNVVRYGSGEKVAPISRSTSPVEVGNLLPPG